MKLRRKNQKTVNKKIRIKKLTKKSSKKFNKKFNKKFSKKFNKKYNKKYKKTGLRGGSTFSDEMTRKVKEQGAHLVEGAAAAAKKAAAEKAKSMIDDGTRHAEEFVKKGADRARDKLDYMLSSNSEPASEATSPNSELEAEAADKVERLTQEREAARANANAAVVEEE